MMLAALSIIGLTDIHQMNGLKNLLALCINGVAAMYFVAKATLNLFCLLSIAPACLPTWWARSHRGG